MPPKKLAIFVEGQTEQVFFKSFIEHIAGTSKVTFDLTYQHANKYLLLTSQNPTAKYHILIVDCRNDDKVKSAILEQYESLLKNGYTKILGVRDLHPRSLGDLKKIKRGLKYGIPKKTPIYILLAVQEIESWFILEHQHFAKIDRRLQPNTFRTSFGFCPINDPIEKLSNPADFLRRVYNSVRKPYNKNLAQVQRTVKCLDYASLYMVKNAQAPHLRAFVRHIDSFLS